MSLGPRDVAVVLANNAAAPQTVGLFELRLLDTATARVVPPTINNPGSFDDNPDFSQATLTGVWDCNVAGPPSADIDADPATATSQLVCFSPAVNGPTVPPGGTLVLAVVHYNVISAGSTLLELQDSSVYNNGGNELGTCDVSMDCRDAGITTDTDGDGCSDPEEDGPTPVLGGLRDKFNQYDFYDVNGSRKVDSVDIALVRSKFNQNFPAYDRSPGSQPWAPGPPNGIVNAVDIGLVRAEFNHSCQAAP